MSRHSVILFALLLTLGTGVVASAQEDDAMFPGRGRKEPPPHGVEEALVKMRIEKDKKAFNEMLKRGEDAAKLASDLKESPAAEQREQIANIGKLVKKIREELGGDSGDSEDKAVPISDSVAIKALKDEVGGLAEELKKSSRFTISASAIERANAALRLVKFLHD